MVPLNAIALILTIAALAASWISTSRLLWGLGLLCLIICTATYPIYFSSANAELVTGSVRIADVAIKINSWSNWHWFRTGFAMLAVIFAAFGLRQQIDRTSPMSEQKKGMEMDSTSVHSTLDIKQTVLEGN
jgi:hypothetical protein